MRGVAHKRRTHSRWTHRLNELSGAEHHKVADYIEQINDQGPLTAAETRGKIDQHKKVKLRQQSFLIPV